MSSLYQLLHMLTNTCYIFLPVCWIENSILLWLCFTFLLHFPTNEVEHLYMWLLAIQISSSVKYFFTSFAYFCNAYLAFSYLFIGVLHIFWILVLCQLYVFHSPYFSCSLANFPLSSFQFICLFPFFLSLLPLCSVTKCDKGCTSNSVE